MKAPLDNILYAAACGIKNSNNAMKAPDKVYVRKEKDNVIYSLSVQHSNGGEEYIRKDALLEWLGEQLCASYKSMDIRSNLAYSRVVDKIKSLTPDDIFERADKRASEGTLTDTQALDIGTDVIRSLEEAQSKGIPADDAAVAILFKMFERYK